MNELSTIKSGQIKTARMRETAAMTTPRKKILNKVHNKSLGEVFKSFINKITPKKGRKRSSPLCFNP
jgi:hypothetical protein